jgi:hypothetical protein
MNENLKSYVCDNCGQIALAAARGADCPCGGTYSMDPPRLYVGTVIDRLTAETIYRSRPTTWADAQTKAERRAKGDRYKVRVIEA